MARCKGQGHPASWTQRRARPPCPVRRGPVQDAHLQHHAAERLPVRAHVQVHERVPGGRGRVSGAAAAAAAAAGAERGEAQRRGARDREQTEQAGAAAQRQHRGCGSLRESGGRAAVGTETTEATVTRAHRLQSATSARGHFYWLGRPRGPALARPARPLRACSRATPGGPSGRRSQAAGATERELLSRGSPRTRDLRDRHDPAKGGRFHFVRFLDEKKREGNMLKRG